jgi:hypothetical protein
MARHSDDGHSRFPALKSGTGHAVRLPSQSPRGVGPTQASYIGLLALVDVTGADCLIATAIGAIQSAKTEA